MIIEVMETGRNGTGSGKNLSLVLKVPRHHINDWFDAGRCFGIIEIMRTRRDGTGRDGRGENLSSVCKIHGQHIDDWFGAGRSVSGS